MVHRRTAWGQWAVELLQHTAAPPGGSGKWNPCGHTVLGQWAVVRSYCLGAVGTRSPSAHRRTTLGQRAVEFLRYTAAQPWSSGKWIACGTVPCALRQGAVELLQYTAAPPRGTTEWNSHVSLLHCSGHCNSYRTPPHSLGAAGRESSAACPTQWGSVKKDPTAHCPQHWGSILNDPHCPVAGTVWQCTEGS